MESRANSDLFFLPDEKFDFDVSLSPASSKGDEDEDAVFIGPLSHQERCVSVCMASQLEDSSCATRGSWSPLTEDQLEAVRQEAHRLATQLQNGEPRQLQDEDGVTTDGTTNGEEFVQDSKAKLDALVQTARVLSPIKRQTFCVQDSPMKQLPPAVQRQLQRAKGANASSSTRAVTPIKRTSTRSASATTAPPSRPSTTASSSRPTTRLSTSSPATSARSQPKTALRGKAVLGVGSVLPSKPAVAPTSCSVGKSKVEKTRLQPPSKAVGSWRRSQTLRPSSRAESYEDLLSDSASVASDISDSSLNSSQVGKRTLAPPTKNVMRNPSGVKAPPTRATNRKNTSSSSSSVSSFNSSMSLSPAKGKLNSSLNRSLSGSTGPAPSSINRPASHSSKPRCSTVFAAAPEPASSSTANRRSLSTRMLPEAERTKPARSTPLKRAEATPLKGMPAKRVLGRSASVSTSVRTQSVLKAMAKPEAAVLPTPSRDDVSKVLKPKRPMSASNVDSLPMTPSLQMKARRPSALPTPMRHRMSGIPTPTSHTRAARMPPTFDLNSAPRSARKESSVSPAPIVAQEAEPDNTPDIQPFCLEEEQLPSEPSPTSPPCSPPQLDQSESTDSGPPSPGQSEPSKNLIELETMEENHTKSQEVLLLDLPAPALQPQEKLLIDLTNTPDLIRTSTTTCTTSQLIDLSSPLIKWSPEDKRENNAPLINLSF